MNLLRQGNAVKSPVNSTASFVRESLHQRVAVSDLIGNSPEWHERALCTQTDPETFYPEKGGSTRDAKRICGHCDVKPDCLEWALGHDERFGIWGGLSERERRKLKRRG